MKGKDWETCMTMNGTWGYKSYDHNWKSSRTLIRNLIDIASKGGNYLLNVGPKADGTFPEASIERLRDIGKWMKVNSEAIYATKASPLDSLSWGRCTMKENGDNTSLYLFVFDWPTDGKLHVPGLNGKIISSKLLINGETLAVDKGDGGVIINLPATAPDDVASVVKLEVKGKIKN